MREELGFAAIAERSQSLEVEVVRTVVGSDIKDRFHTTGKALTELTFVLPEIQGGRTDDKSELTRKGIAGLLDPGAQNGVLMLTWLGGNDRSSTTQGEKDGGKYEQAAHVRSMYRCANGFGGGVRQSRQRSRRQPR